MGHEPQILPCVALGIVVLSVDGMEGIERFTKPSLTVDAAHESCLRVEILAVGLAALLEVAVVGFPSQFFRHLRHTGIGKGILQTFSHRLVGGVEVARQVTVLLEQVETALVEHRRTPQCLHHLIHVGMASLQCHIGKHGDTGVAYHAVGLVAHEVPHWKFTLLTVDVQQGGSHVVKAFGMDKGHQRMGCPVGVP